MDFLLTNYRIISKEENVFFIWRVNSLFASAFESSFAPASLFASAFASAFASLFASLFASAFASTFAFGQDLFKSELGYQKSDRTCVILCFILLFSF